MKSYSDPSRDEQKDFCLGAYFGFHGQPIDLLIRRAYGDFCRTLHGIGDTPNAATAARRLLRKALLGLSQSEIIGSQSDFDCWHREVDKRMREAFIDGGYKNIHVGQTQKWINMALKYVFVYGEERLPGFKPFYRYCHVPIDNILLGKDVFKELDAFGCPWSRIVGYDNYFEFQLAVRKAFPGSSPLAVEFHVWSSK